MVEKDARPAGDESASSDPPPEQGQRKSAPRSWVMGYFALFAILAIVIGSVTVFGAPPNHNPTIWIKLEPAPRAQAQEQVAPANNVIRERVLGGHLVADPALIEDTLDGPLPIVAADGRAPMQAYARAHDEKAKGPRIAIIIGGLDVGAGNTKLALAKLRPEVTLAFAPFASKVQESIDAAREAGHEVLLEVPMEPFDFPESDPGPHALLVGASSNENIKRLCWAMSRFTGYVGVTNFLGGRFMSEQSALEPVLGEIARRGLIFVDDGESKSSIALTVARHAKAAIATGTLVLDNVQTKEAIDGKLVELEAGARRNGFAVAVGSPYPVTIARLAEWSQALEARGFVLVPVSALAAKPSEQQASASPARR